MTKQKLLEVLADYPDDAIIEFVKWYENFGISVINNINNIYYNNNVNVIRFVIENN